MPAPNKKYAYIKNPERGKPQLRERYVPQYQLLDITPNAVDIGANLDTPNVAPAHKVEVVARAPFASITNPRTRPVPTSASRFVPYAEEGPPQLGRDPLPNVGSNIETTWTSLDDMVFDAEGNLVEPENQTMLDNNQDDPANYADIPAQLPIPKSTTQPVILQEVQEEPIQMEQIGPEDGVLIVKGEILSVASLTSIEEEVRALVYGEHPLCEANKIDPEDIVVLKRVNIKVGVFLEK